MYCTSVLAFLCHAIFELCFNNYAQLTEEEMKRLYEAVGQDGGYAAVGFSYDDQSTKVQNEAQPGSLQYHMCCLSDRFLLTEYEIVP